MISFRGISPDNPRFQEIEFTLLLGWALLFPAKIGYPFFLGFMVLACAFILAKARYLKNLVLDRFAIWLFFVNLLFLLASFFSPHPLKSLLFTADVMMLSLWFVLFFLQKGDEGRFLELAAGVISIASVVIVGAFVLKGTAAPATPVFRNPILQGIASSLAVLVFLDGLLRRYRHSRLLLLLLNAAAVVVSASKAAALGLAVFAAAMLLRRRRRWLIYLGAGLALLAVFPNPLKRMALHSLRHDPYVLNRIDIWRMSARMFRAHPWTGIGPDLFAEIAPRYNFPQEQGPARYFKIPESPHSDYWKVIVENGLFGLLLVLGFLFFAVRRLFCPDCLSGWLLAYLLAQMLLFNFIFQFFFFILFLFLLRNCFPEGRRFVTPRPGFRAWTAALAVLTLLLLYLLAVFADHLLSRAGRERDVARRFDLLRQASRLSPLDERAPLAQAGLLLAYIRSRPGPALDDPGVRTAWSDAWQHARRAQRLDGAGIVSRELEADLFRHLMERGIAYPGLCAEILEPLLRAEELAPLNPFLKLRQALVLESFDRIAEAKALVLAALDLEPDFAAAVVLLHRLHGLADDDPGLSRRLAEISKKADRLQARPGSYLSRLHEIPADWRSR